MIAQDVADAPVLKSRRFMIDPNKLQWLRTPAGLPGG